VYAGLQQLEVDDPVQGVRLPVALMYPTGEAARPERIGPYTVVVARDAPLPTEPLPLALISHGGRGSPWVYRGLAEHLARAGYLVALPEHLGDSRSDSSLDHDERNLVNRPRHIRLAIDAALETADVDLDRGVAAIGHSIGGYGVLAAAGGNPMTLPPEVPAEQRRDPTPEIAKLAYPIETETDPRIDKIVLLAPAVGFFMADGSLAEVTAPLLVRTAEHDHLCPTAQVSVALRSLTTSLDHSEVAGAGHFSFSTPFPPEMSGPHFPPSQDPDGFDRGAYLPTLYAEIESFL
jgi:predicted dienelactone hydrolase